MDDERLTLGDVIGRDPWPDADRRLDIEIALDKMLPKYRKALILWGQGFSYSMIAKKMDIGKATAYRYVQAGRKTLEQSLL